MKSFASCFDIGAKKLANVTKFPSMTFIFLNLRKVSLVINLRSTVIHIEGYILIEGFIGQLKICYSLRSQILGGNGKD